MIYNVRRRLRFFFARNLPRRYSRKTPRTVTAAAVLVITVSITLNTFFTRTLPVIKALAIVETNEYVVAVMKRVVEREINSGGLIYSELMALEKDENGAVAAIITDMAKVNALQSQISALVAEEITNAPHKDLYVPLGDALGTTLFSWRGPKLPVNMKSVSNVTTQLAGEFEVSGFNQIRHRLALTITADIVIHVPFGRTSAVVTSTVPIAEAVIIGSIPNIYNN